MEHAKDQDDDKTDVVYLHEDFIALASHEPERSQYNDDHEGEASNPR